MYKLLKINIFLLSRCMVFNCTEVKVWHFSPFKCTPLKYYYILLLLCLKEIIVALSESYELVFLHWVTYTKETRRFNTRVYFLWLCIYWSGLTVWLPLQLEILRNLCILIIFCTSCDVISFETDLSFLIKLVFLPYDQKSG